MRDPLRQFWATFERISLPPAKKAEGLQMLKTALRLMKEGQSVATLDPTRKASFQRQLSTVHTQGETHDSWFAAQWSVRSWLRIPAIAVLAIFIAAGTGVVGAEAALPGDFLYPVKISITEPLIGALQFSPEARAQWQVRLLARRAREAERARRTRDATIARLAEDALRLQMSNAATYIAALPSPVTQAVLREQVQDVFSGTSVPESESSASALSSSSSAATSSSASSVAPRASSSSSLEASYSSRSTYSVPHIRSTYGSPSLRPSRSSYSVPNLRKP